MIGSNIKSAAKGCSVIAAATTLALSVSALTSPVHADDLPQGRAGECFEKVRIGPVFKTVDETRPRPPRVTYKTRAAVYGTETVKVLSRRARTTYEIRPAVYETRKVFRTTPGEVHEVATAPVYQTVVERTLVEPEHLAWRRGRSDAGYADRGSDSGVEVTPTGEVLCRVLVPARYAVTRRRVLVRPAGVREVQGPDRKIICFERVRVRAAERIPHYIPAEYKSVTRRKLVTPAARERVETPQAPIVIHRRVLVTPARVEWRRFACKAKAPQAAGERG